MQNEAMELLKSIERTASKTFARLTQEQVEQRKSNQAILQQVETIGRQVTRLCSQIPEQNREGASYGIRHVQDQYKHRTHHEDNRDPEVKQRLKEQVKGYATTIKATEAERRPPPADPFSQLFSGEFRHEEIDLTYVIPKTSQDERDQNRNNIAGWVQAVKRAGHQVTNIPLTKKPREPGTDPRATPRDATPHHDTPKPDPQATPRVTPRHDTPRHDRSNPARH